MKRGLLKSTIFLALTFASSWSLAAAFFAHGRLPITLLAVLYMFTPALSALVTQRLFKEPMVRPLGLSFKPNVWWLVAWVAPVVLSAASLGVGLWMPGVSFSWGMENLYERFASSLTPEQLALMKAQTAQLPLHPIWLAVAAGLLAGPTINTIAALGEEIGWRGLLQKELSGLGFWRTALVTGLVWGVWHAPLVLHGWNYPGHPREGVFFMVYFTLLLSPLLAYLRLRGHSVVVPAIFHGTINAVAGIAIMPLKGGSDLTTGLTGLAGLAVLAVAVVGMWLYDRLSGARGMSACRVTFHSQEPGE